MKVKDLIECLNGTHDIYMVSNDDVELDELVFNGRSTDLGYEELELPVVAFEAAGLQYLHVFVDTSRYW